MEHYFWVILGVRLWKRLAFESADWWKKMALPHKNGYHLISWGPDWEGGETGRVVLLALFELRHLPPPIFRHWRYWFLGSWTRMGTYTITLPTLRHLDSSWFIPLAFWVLWLADSRLWALLAFITLWAHSYNKSPHISIYLPPIGLISPKHPHTPLLAAVSGAVMWGPPELVDQ